MTERPIIFNGEMVRAIIEIFVIFLAFLIFLIFCSALFIATFVEANIYLF